MDMRQTMKADPFICFVHIERCGGTTLHHLIQRNFPHYVALRSWYYWSNEEGHTFDVDDLRNLRKLMPWIGGIGGHTVRSHENYEAVVNRRVFRFAFFREPVSRYLSHLNYQRNVMGIEWDVQDFLDEPRFNNYQTVRLAGSPDVDRALQEAEESLDFVGLTERYDESLVLLEDRLRPFIDTVRYERKNATPSVISWDMLSKAQQEQVQMNNLLDIELYGKIKNRLYERQVREYSGNLERDLEVFRNSLNDFSPPVSKIMLLKLYRNIIRYVVQPMAAGRLRRKRRPWDNTGR